MAVRVLPEDAGLFANTISSPASASTEPMNTTVITPVEEFFAVISPTALVTSAAERTSAMQSPTSKNEAKYAASSSAESPYASTRVRSCVVAVALVELFATTPVEKP